MSGIDYIKKYLAETIEMVEQKANRKVILRRLNKLAEMLGVRDETTTR